MKLPAIILIACTSLYAQTALASKWYKLEMIVVAYTNMADIDQEYWPSLLENKPTYPSKPRISWIYPYNNKATNRSVIRRFGVPNRNRSTARLISKLKTNSLTEQAEKINENEHMKVVYHKSWLEPIQSEKRASAHKFKVALKEEPMIEINGEFKLHRNRYLHIQTDFHVQHYEKKSLEEQAQEADKAPEQAQNQQQPSSQITENTQATENTEQSSELEPKEEVEVIIPVRAAHVKLTRRMRSNEMHYLDHPMLGIIIKAIPVDKM